VPPPPKLTKQKVIRAGAGHGSRSISTCLKMFFKVISNHTIYRISLEDFPKAKNTRSQKCVAKPKNLLKTISVVSLRQKSYIVGADNSAGSQLILLIRS